MLVAARPCLWIILLRHPLATRDPRNHLLKAQVVHLHGRHLTCSSLPLQVALLVSLPRATAHRTTCLPVIMPPATRRLLEDLRWHTLAGTAHSCRLTHWRCQATASAGHQVSHHQTRHLLHHRAAMIVHRHRGTACRTTTAAALLPSHHQATQEAVSSTTAMATLATCLSTYQAELQKLVVAHQVRILKTYSRTTVLRARKRGSRETLSSNQLCSRRRDRIL
jgi:hypothetical protein